MGERNLVSAQPAVSKEKTSSFQSRERESERERERDYRREKRIATALVKVTHPIGYFAIHTSIVAVTAALLVSKPIAVTPCRLESPGPSARGVMACTTTTHGAPCNSSSRIRSCFAVLSFLLVITGNAEGVRLNSEILVFG